MAVTLERSGFRFIPGPFQYSGGVAALPGHAIRHARFTRPVPLADGFARIEAFLRDAGLPLTAFCACELRSPAPFTDAGFIAFNRAYCGTLERWGIMQGEENPVARSNVCPELHKPDSPSFYAFSYVVAADGPRPPSFVIAGSGEAQEGAGPYRDRTVRFGDTSPAGMADKVRFVMGQMEGRMAALDLGWAQVTATQVYTVFDMHPSLADAVVLPGAAVHGVTWHYCRPPVEGLDFEMDCRGAYEELVLDA